tara:strand:+ start:1665 stop:2114 length:450 start_codon:yes stop_codon:yes gene_type:complete
MANAASVTITATVLPDNIAKSISGSQTVTPGDANDKWYYKFTNVSNSSTNLMAGYFTDYTGVDDDTAPTAVHTADKVKFLFVKNTDSSNDVYINVADGAASSSAAGSIKIPAGQSVALQIPNSTVDNIHAITSTGTVDCIVAALLDDVA